MRKKIINSRTRLIVELIIRFLKFLSIHTYSQLCNKNTAAVNLFYDVFMYTKKAIKLIVYTNFNVVAMTIVRVSKRKNIINIHQL